jgi:PIN domain nuclease of toxin-antitoxin system
MRLLLDTHIWIWTHLESWNISSEVTNELASPRNELWLSPLSIWELVLLVEKKRLDLNADMGEWVQQSMKDLGASRKLRSHLRWHTNYDLRCWDIATRAIDSWWHR